MALLRPTVRLRYAPNSTTEEEMIEIPPVFAHSSYSFDSKRSSISVQVKKCLEEIYHLDPCIAESIVQKISQAPLSLLDDFICLSQTVALLPPKEQKLSALAETDATLLAPESHRVLFENDLIRILESNIQSGEFVPAHTHQWDSVMIILQGSQFLIQSASGTLSEGTWEPGVEKFPGSLDFDAYTNIGAQEFRAISFEFKN